MMKSQDDTSFGSALKGGWVLRILLLVLVNWGPQNGLAQATNDAYARTPNLGNPAIALALVNQRIQFIELHKNQVFREQSPFFETNNVGHNLSLGYMLRLLDLLESRSENLHVVSALKDERIAAFRSTLGKAKAGDEFRASFGDFLTLLNEIRGGLIEQLASSHLSSPASLGLSCMTLL